MEEAADDLDIMPFVDVDLSEEQYATIRELRASFLKAHADDNDGAGLAPHERIFFDHRCMFRYLVATKGKKDVWKPDAALTMLNDSLTWRRETRPDLISIQRVRRQIRRGSNYFGGFDKYGRPVLNLRIRYDWPHDWEGKNKIMTYDLERGLRLVREARRHRKPNKDGVNAEQIVWIISMDGFGRRHMSRQATSVNVGFARILQAHYPESLGFCFIYNAPWLFRMLWGMLKVFIDNRTSSKLSFPSGVKTIAKQALEFIPEETLEEEFGGKNDHKYDHASYMEQMLKEEEQWYLGDEPEGSIHDHSDCSLSEDDDGDDAHHHDTPGKGADDEEWDEDIAAAEQEHKDEVFVPSGDDLSNLEVCRQCQQGKPKEGYSASQWKKKPAGRRLCKECAQTAS